MANRSWSTMTIVSGEPRCQEISLDSADTAEPIENNREFWQLARTTVVDIRQGK